MVFVFSGVSNELFSPLEKSVQSHPLALVKNGTRKRVAFHYTQHAIGPIAG